MKVTHSVEIVDKVEAVMKKIAKEFGLIAFEMEADAKRYAPIETGRLRNSIFLRKVNKFEYEMFDGVEYGVFVEYSTSPHIIRPVKGKALKFKVDNKTVFAKSVMHPGTTAQPFFRPAFDIAKAKVKLMFT